MTRATGNTRSAWSRSKVLGQGWWWCLSLGCIIKHFSNTDNTPHVRLGSAPMVWLSHRHRRSVSSGRHVVVYDIYDVQQSWHVPFLFLYSCLQTSTRAVWRWYWWYNVLLWHKQQFFRPNSHPRFIWHLYRASTVDDPSRDFFRCQRWWRSCAVKCIVCDHTFLFSCS